MKFLILITFITLNLIANNDELYNEIITNYKSSLSIMPIKNKIIINEKIIVPKKEHFSKTIHKQEIIKKKINNKITYHTIKNSFQNLRVNSSNNSLILHVLSKGTKVILIKKIYKNNNLWLKVNYLNSKKKHIIGYLFEGRQSNK